MVYSSEEEVQAKAISGPFDRFAEKPAALFHSREPGALYVPAGGAE